MDTIFRDDDYYYYIGDDCLDYGKIHKFKKMDDIPHLDDADALYHYKNVATNHFYPVYYELNGRFLTKSINDEIGYDIYPCDGLIKDYTLVNLKLL